MDHNEDSTKKNLSLTSPQSVIDIAHSLSISPNSTGGQKLNIMNHESLVNTSQL